MTVTVVAGRAMPLTWMLVALFGAQPIATDLYLPALPAIARELGSASSSLTWFMLAFGLGQLVNGPLADRIGRRPVLLGGLVLYVACALAGALAGSVFQLALARALQGLAMSAILVCIRAAVRDLHPAHEGPRIMAHGLSGLGLVAMVAPVLGAAVVQQQGWRWAMACMAVYGALVLGFCWWRFSETRPALVPTQANRAWAVLSSRSFWQWTMLSTTSFAAMFCFLLLSPALYIEYLGLSTQAYGWVPASGSLVYVAGTSTCRWLLKRHDVLTVVRGGACLSLAGALIQLGSAWWAPQVFWPLLLGHWFYALGHGVHQPCGQAGAVGEFPHLAGRAVAWSGFVMMAMAFLTGQVASRFMDPQHQLGTWPLVVPMVLAAMGLMGLAFGWLRPSGGPRRED